MQQPSKVNSGPKTAGLVGIIALWLLSACAAGPNPPEPIEPDGGWTLENAIQWARADLGQSLGVDGEAVTVISARAVIWASGARGCPRPDQSYTQALVPGHQIILEHDRETVYYHAGGNEQPFRCPEAFRVAPSRVGPAMM